MSRKRLSILVAFGALAFMALACDVSGCSALQGVVPTEGGGPGVAVQEPAAEGAASGSGGAGILDIISTTLPAKPSNLGAALTAIYDVRVSWQDNSTDEDGFIVSHVRIDVPEPAREVAIAGRDVTTDIDQFTTCDATYRYIVASYNEAGKNPTEECWVIQTPPCPTIQTLTLGANEDYDFLNNLRNPANGGDFGVQAANGGIVFTTGANPNGGISNAGQLGSTPLFDVNIHTSSGFNSGQTPAVQGSAYIAKARRPGDYVVFQVAALQAATPAQVTLNWFYYDATGEIIAQTCESAGHTPDPVCPDSVCDITETVAECPQDCGIGCVLGDGLLGPGETCDSDAECEETGFCSPLTCMCGNRVNECVERIPPGRDPDEPVREVLFDGGRERPTETLRTDEDGEGDGEGVVEPLIEDPPELLAEERGDGGGGGPVHPPGPPCTSDVDCREGEFCDPRICACRGVTCEDYVPPALRGEIVAVTGDVDLDGSTVTVKHACVDDADCPAGITCDLTTCSCDRDFTCRDLLEPGHPLLGEYLPAYEAVVCTDDTHCPTGQTCDADGCTCACPAGTDMCTSNDDCRLEYGPGYLCDNCNCIPDERTCPADSHGCDKDTDCTEAFGAGFTCDVASCNCIPDERTCPTDSHMCTSNDDCRLEFGAGFTCNEVTCNCEGIPDNCPANSSGCTTDAYCQSLLGDPNALCNTATCFCYTPCPPNSICGGLAPGTTCTTPNGQTGACQGCDCIPTTGGDEPCPGEDGSLCGDGICQECESHVWCGDCPPPDEPDEPDDPPPDVCPAGTPCAGLPNGATCVQPGNLSAVITGVCQDCNCVTN